MNFKALRQLVGSDNMDVSVDSHNGIVDIKFILNGVPMSCQYDDHNKGLYAFALRNDDDAQFVLSAIFMAERPEEEE